MNASKEETYYFLISSARRALIGEVMPCFRAVALEWQEDTAHLYFYIDGEITAELHDHCTSIGAEVVASFSKAKIYEDIIRLDYPNPLPKHRHWAFTRKENVHVENMASQDYEGLFHSAQFALLDKIIPSMRGAAIETSNRSASLLLYIDGLFGEDFQEICAEIMLTLKSLNPLLEISSNIVRIDFPDPLPEHGINWIYLRKEQMRNNITE